MFGGLLPEGIRNRLLSGIAEIRSGLLRETGVTADMTLVNEDEWLVCLRVTEEDAPLFETRLSVGSREDARTLCRNWKENAARLYPQVISLLLGDQGP